MSERVCSRTCTRRAARRGSAATTTGTQAASKHAPDGARDDDRLEAVVSSAIGTTPTTSENGAGRSAGTVRNGENGFGQSQRGRNESFDYAATKRRSSASSPHTDVHHPGSYNMNGGKTNSDKHSSADVYRAIFDSPTEYIREGLSNMQYDRVSVEHNSLYSLVSAPATRARKMKLKWNKRMGREKERGKNKIDLDQNLKN